MDKEKLLGGVQTEESKGGTYSPDPAELRQPLEMGVVYCFCNGCGVYLEITSNEAASELAQIAGVEVPLSWENYYFDVNKCSVCTNDEPFEIELKKISQLEE